MSKARCLFSLIFLIISFFPVYRLNAKKPCRRKQPKLTVVMVVDQLAHHHIKKVKPYLQYGFKDLMCNGVVYTNAYHAHGIPETTPGHHALSTGTFPKDHGAVTNQWVDIQCKKVAYDEDTSEDAALLTNPTCRHDGRSCKKTMIDGLSDQFVLRSTESIPNKVFALALKSYPAIAMANRLGKAIWFDEKRGVFTSSKKYFSKLPDWVSAFNTSVTYDQLKKSKWQLLYNEDSDAYDFPYIKNYDFAGAPHSLVGRTLIDKQENSNKEKNKNSPKSKYLDSPYKFFVLSPFSSSALLNLAKKCIETNIDKQHDNTMLLWVSLSNFDLAGHIYGPDSLEITDMLYQIDKQIQDFMNFLDRFVGEKNYLLVLTSDHGIAPIPEVQKLKGYTEAQRIMVPDLLREINTDLFKTFGIKTLVSCFEPSSFRIDHAVLRKFDAQKKEEIIRHILSYLKQHPGVKNAWTYDELEKTTFQPHDLENYYKNQLYSGRIGDIICQPKPYCLITHYPTGTSHATPYEYDTHVPLILYNKGRLKPKWINDRVWIPQVPVTLAKSLHIPKPSGSPFDPLPGILK